MIIPHFGKYIANGVITLAIVGKSIWLIKF